MGIRNQKIVILPPFRSAAGFYYVSDIIFSMFVGDMLLMMAMLLMSNCLISDISPTFLLNAKLLKHPSQLREGISSVLSSGH